MLWGNLSFLVKCVRVTSWICNGLPIHVTCMYNTLVLYCTCTYMYMYVCGGDVILGKKVSFFGEK